LGFNIEALIRKWTESLTLTSEQKSAKLTKLLSSKIKLTKNYHSSASYYGEYNEESLDGKK
jgi:hypothetical protein